MRYLGASVGPLGAWRAAGLLAPLLSIACTSGALRETPAVPSVPEAVACGPDSDWISRTPTLPGFVYGVGVADIRYGSVPAAIDQARKRALVELLQQLEVTIVSDTIVESERSRSGSGNTFAVMLREEIRTSTESTELPGVEIAEQCIDQAGNAVYALARLDRERASHVLTGRRNTIADEVRSIATIPHDAPRVLQLRRMMPALELIESYEQLGNELRVVSGEPVAPAPDITAVEARIDALLDQLRIELRPVGDSSQEIEADLARNLTNHGLRVSDFGKSDLVLEYQVRARETQAQGIFFVYADGEVRILDDSGRVLATEHETIKGGSPVSAAQAHLRAIDELGDRLGELVGDTLLDRL
ncbi:MAG: LPP20 family lipoprotein [Pseudomonadota bacterium]|nr:LPP20 family lipoprotein [Pseudomonadota bacterium]